MAILRQANLPPATGRPSSGYLPALDGLRALGISLVFLHHMVTPLPFGGAVGVDIFFVLSGYLITAILLGEKDRTGTIRLKRFYLRRAARLYPALLTVMAVLAVPGLFIARYPKAYALENFLAATYTTPLALEFKNDISWSWRHTWSLGIEEMFYLVWPLLLIILLARTRAGATAPLLVGGVGAALLMSAVLIEAAGNRDSLLLRSGGLFFGCALALWLRTRSSSHRPGRLSPVGAWAGLVLIGAGIFMASTDGVLALPVLLTVLGTTAVLSHLVTSSANGHVTRFLSWSPLAYLGRISYELYLWHYPLLIITGWAFDAEPIAVAIFVAPASVIAAAVTHHLLTPRIEQLKARVSR